MCLHQAGLLEKAFYSEWYYTLKLRITSSPLQPLHNKQWPRKKKSTSIILTATQGAKVQLMPVALTSSAVASPIF